MALIITTNDTQITVSKGGEVPLCFPKNSLCVFPFESSLTLQLVHTNVRFRDERWSNGITCNGVEVTRENYKETLSDLFFLDNGDVDIDSKADKANTVLTYSNGNKAVEVIDDTNIRLYHPTGRRALDTNWYAGEESPSRLPFFGLSAPGNGAPSLYLGQKFSMLAYPSSNWGFVASDERIDNYGHASTTIYKGATIYYADDFEHPGMNFDGTDPAGKQMWMRNMSDEYIYWLTPDGRLRFNELDLAQAPGESKEIAASQDLLTKTVKDSVKSTSVSSIVSLTQAEYDAIETKDSNTLYLIK